MLEIEFQVKLLHLRRRKGQTTIAAAQPTVYNFRSRDCASCR